MRYSISKILHVRCEEIEIPSQEHCLSVWSKTEPRCYPVPTLSTNIHYNPHANVRHFSLSVVCQRLCQMENDFHLKYIDPLYSCHHVKVRTSHQENYSLIGKDNYRIPDQCKWWPQRMSATIETDQIQLDLNLGFSQVSSAALKALSRCSALISIFVPSMGVSNLRVQTSRLRHFR